MGREYARAITDVREYEQTLPNSKRMLCPRNTYRPISYLGYEVNSFFDLWMPTITIKPPKPFVSTALLESVQMRMSMRTAPEDPAKAKKNLKKARVL